VSMDILNAHDLLGLADQRGGSRISIFLPTHRGGPQTERNRIRLKNQLRHAQHALRADGMTTGPIEAMLEPGHQLLDLVGLWDQPSDGLAVFLGPDGPRHLRVPLRLPELVTLGDRFVVRPLLPLLSDGGHFYVLALSQDEIRLFHGTRVGLDHVELDGLPLAVWLTMPRRRPQVHTFLADRGGTGGRAVFHGGDDNDAKPLILQHFRRVDQALRELLGGDQAPVVLAGVRYLQAIYHQANTHPQLVSAGIDGSPRDAGPDQLHRRAWTLVEPLLRGQESAAAAEYRALQGTGRTSSTPEEVFIAARQGRIGTLFLRIDTPEWRTRADGEPLVLRTDTSTLSDQLDLAAVATLRQAGTVYAVPAARMPDANPVAATLRY
jgi:Bacterial archaeo-eukaryotic release factor family 3